ncbi:hypothetical protein PIB30_055538, partial [Stylosanthes scabra]|nr:hypothetical protein [Stylosanthes scabra]
MLTYFGVRSSGGLAKVAAGTRNGDSNGSVCEGRWSRRRRPLQLNGGVTARERCGFQHGEGGVVFQDGRGRDAASSRSSCAGAKCGSFRRQGNRRQRSRKGKGAAMADFSRM